MDRRRAFAPLLILACGAGETVPLREARWITPEARFEQLSTVVAPCISDFGDNPLPGAVAFEDPLLLGGQAARAGLSCASCHRGGQGNPAFSFPGVSGVPGTADITASILSSHRGDGIFNPRLIPDLTNDPPRVSRTDPGALEAFIRGLIIEEFDGPEPPKRLLDSLAAYVRALDPAQCKPSRPREAIYDLARYAMALEQAITAIDDGDLKLAYTMLRAARSRLGLIAERYAEVESGETLARLVEASEALKRAREQIDAKADPVPVRRDLVRRREALLSWTAPILEEESHSLYDRARLTKAMVALGN